MRKLFTILFIFIITSTCYAQLVGEDYPQIKVGLIGGMNFASISNFDHSLNQLFGSDTTIILSQPFRQSRGTRINIGVACNIAFSKWYSLQPELSLFQTGVNTSAQFTYVNNTGKEDETRNFTINYIQLPVLSKFSFGSRKYKFHLLAGPALTYAASMSETITDGAGIYTQTRSHDITIDNGGLERIDVLAIAGVGITLVTGVGDFVVDCRYNIGLRDINNNSNLILPSSTETNKNNVISLNVGFLFDSRLNKE